MEEAPIPNDMIPVANKTKTGRTNHTISKLGSMRTRLLLIASELRNIVTVRATDTGIKKSTSHISINPNNQKLHPPVANIIELK